MWPPDFKKAVPGLLTLTGIFFLNFLTRVILAPFLVLISQEFQLTKTQAGELFLVLSLGYSLGLLTSSVISSRLGHGKTVILSALGIGFCLFLASFSPSASWLRSLLLLAGIFGGLYFPSGFALMTSMVAPGNWGKAIAIHELAPNLSFVLAPILAEIFLSTGLGWRWMLVAVSGYALAAFILFVKFCGCPDIKGSAPVPSMYLKVVAKPAFWVLLLFFTLAIGSTQGVFAQTPMYLTTSTSIDPGWVNYILSASRISGLFLVFWAGYLVDTLGINRSLYIFMGLTGLCTMSLGMFSGGLLIAAVIIQPTMACCYFPAGFAAMSRSFSPEQRPLAISLIVPGAVLAGGGGIPTILGWFGDMDMFNLGFVCLGAVIAASIMFIHLLEPAQG